MCHQVAHQLCHQGQVQDLAEQNFLEAVIRWLHVRLAQLCHDSDQLLNLVLIGLLMVASIDLLGLLRLRSYPVRGHQLL